MDAIIRPATERDAQAVCDIYNPFVADTIVTFEQELVTAEDMAHRIQRTTAEYPWLVTERDAQVVAYAYAARWRTRAAYDRSAETTIYVRRGAQSTGLGRPLYLALLAELRQRGIHAAIGCIALPNDASVAFHERCGFVKVGHFPEVGRKFDRWVDVGFWQLPL